MRKDQLSSDAESQIIQKLSRNGPDGSPEDQEHVPLQGASLQWHTGWPEISHPLNPRSSTMMFFIPESSLDSDR